MEKKVIEELVTNAVNGDRGCLEQLLLEIKDLVFNLSLRMLGTIPDAEDATQDILVKVMTNLSSFRKESAFQTWVYRIAANYLIDYKKSMFAKQPLRFDFYAQDIQAGFIENDDELLMGVSRRELAKELKLSCTNVMLQCFDPQTRCIFILGTMFHLDSQTAGEILGMTPENYRQKLSRARKKMAGFLSVNCGLSATGCCSCEKRVGYAIQSHRLNPHKLDFHELKPLDYELLWDFKESMEEIDDQSIIFAQLPKYQSREEVKYFIQNVLASDQMKTIENYTGGLRK